MDEVDQLIDEALSLPTDRSKEAFSGIEQAISLMPSNARGFCARGVLWHRESNLVNAVQDFERALTLDEEHLNSLYNLAVVRFEQKEFDLTIELTSRAILFGDSFRSYFYRGRANLELFKIDLAVADFTYVAESDSLRPNALMQRGVAYSRAGRYMDAMFDFESVPVESECAELHAWKAAVLNELEERQKAIVESNLALSLDVNNAEAWFQRGIAEYTLSLFAEANLSFQESVARVQSNGPRISDFLKRGQQKDSSQ